jgi:hypothetical protein|tara:strand:+ start:1123 stop:1296 length:174 start_codon:yes stop_codon:yes gene_type:complete
MIWYSATLHHCSHQRGSSRIKAHPALAQRHVLPALDYQMAGAILSSAVGGGIHASAV